MAWKDKAQALQSWLHETAPARKEAFEQVRVPTSRTTCLVWGTSRIHRSKILLAQGPDATVIVWTQVCISETNVSWSPQCRFPISHIHLKLCNTMHLLGQIQVLNLQAGQATTGLMSHVPSRKKKQSNSTHEGFGKLCGQRDSSVETQRRTVWATMSRCN